MSNNNSNSKKTIFCIYGIIVLLLIAANVTAFGRTKAEVPKPQIPEIVKLKRRVRVSADELRAEEAYEKRNAEIAPWVEDDAPPNPDNAALLYYQAFLLRPDLDMTISQKIDDVFGGDDVLGGVEFDRQIRIYLGRCLPIIEMAEIASRIPQCTWGIRHGRGPGFDRLFLSPSVYHLSRILLVDAKILAADGHYRAALERCLTVRRFARHLGEDSKLNLLARNPDVMALRTIQYVLDVMPPDADILTWFRGQLAVVKGLPLSFAEMLRAESKSFFNLMRTNPVTLALLRSVLVEKAEDEQAKENARNLTDEQFLSRAREPFPRFIDSIIRILDSEMTYEQKRAQMQRLIDKLKESDDIDPVVKCVILVPGMDAMIERQYPFLVGHAAYINGIKTAVEVYLVVAKTGQLPEKLPDGLPKDPFTGRDFVYEITDEGFALRCQDEEFLRRKNRFLEFKVRK
jgi:hypothetical protein